jgi:hypothetical protein
MCEKKLLKQFAMYFVMGTKTTRLETKPRTQQGKKIIRNANLKLIQDWKHKDARHGHNIC